MDEGQTEKAQEMSTGLSAKQEMAVLAMVRGKGVVATAKMVGVGRVTLYRWMQEPAFVAAMNRWRLAVFETARGQLAGTLAQAAQTVADRVREGDGRLSMTLLKEAGVLKTLRGPGAGLDAETVARQMELDRQAGQMELDQLERQLAEAEQMNAMLRQGRTPTAEELAEQHRQREHEWDVEIAKKAREEEEAEAERQRKSQADPSAGPSESDREAGGTANPAAAAPALAKEPEAKETAGSEPSSPPSTRMSMAEVDEYCDRLTRRRDQPPRPRASSVPAVPPKPPRPGSPGFIGPLLPSFPPRLSGGLAPLYHGPSEPTEPEEPIDPLEDAFTDIWREDWR